MRLRSHLIALVVAALLPLGIFAAAMIVLFGREQQSKLERSLVDTARILSQTIDRELEASIRSLQVLATSQYLQSGHLKQFYDQAAAVMKNQPYWDTISLTDKSGRQLLTLRRPFGAPPLPASPNNPARLRVFETGRPAVTDLFTGRITQTPLIAVTVPVFRNGKVQYALAAPFSPSSFLQLVSRQVLPTDWMAAIIDGNGLVIARTRNFERFVGKPAVPAFAAASREKTHGTWRGITQDDLPVYGGFHRSALSGWSSSLAIPVSVAEASYWRLLKSLTVGSALLLLLGVALAFLIARRISSSIAALSESARVIGRGEVPRLPALPIIEINEAARAMKNAAVERERADEAVRQARSRTESVLSSVADIHILFDRSWRYLYVNEAAVRAIGRPREKILQSTLWELYPDIAGTELERQYRRAMDERVPVDCEFHYPTLDTWWENRFYPAPEGLAVFATDITERMRAHHMHSRLAAIVESSDDAIIGRTLDGTITSWNKAAERIFDCSAEAAIGRHISIIIPSGGRDIAAANMEKLLGGRPIESREITRLNQFGEPVHISMKVSPIKDAAGRIVGASNIARDVSRLKRAEEELRTALQRAEELSRRLLSAQETERRRLARELHDEIGQALTAIKINLQGLMRYPDPASQIERVEDSVAIADRLLQQVRRISLDLRPPLLDDLGLVAALRSHATHQVERAGMRLEFLTDPSFPRLDPELENVYFRIAQEAITNVVRHAGAQTVKVKLRLENGALHLFVTDDGTGFDVARALDNSHEGTGFGLLSMQERLSLIGGRISFGSRAGGGTEVHAVVALVAQEARTAAAISRETG